MYSGSNPQVVDMESVKAESAMDLVKKMLVAIGEDPNRDGLKNTPFRVVKSWPELFSGYRFGEEAIKGLMTEFESDGYDEMVIMRGVDFTSHCEHHMMPFSGIAHIAYIPNKKVVGISKLIRLLEVFTKRLQIQERITQQVTGHIMEYLNPKGAACTLIARHSCISCRGVDKQSADMITSSLKGVFLEEGPARSEYMSFIGLPK